MIVASGSRNTPDEVSRFAEYMGEMMGALKSLPALVSKVGSPRSQEYRECSKGRAMHSWLARRRRVENRGGGYPLTAVVQPNPGSVIERRPDRSVRVTTMSRLSIYPTTRRARPSA